MLLTSCSRHDKQPVPVRHSPTLTRIVALPHGSIGLVPGSAEDGLARFMASHDAPPRTFRFAKDQFAPWAAELTPQSRGTLATLIVILNNYPETKLSLAGYTDNVGTADVNLALSQHRVDLVKRLLVNGGVPAAAISAIGMGVADPIGDNNTPAGRALNRRIELTVTAKP